MSGLIVINEEIGGGMLTPPGYVGHEGEMMNLADVRVVFKRHYDNDRGGYWLYKFATSLGDDLTCFYSGDKFEAEEGDVVHIRFKVKEHAQFRGLPQTKISNISRIDEGYARTGIKPSKRHTPKRAGAPLTKDENWGANIPVDDRLGF